MLRKGTDFSEESVEKSWGKDSDDESGSKFILCFDSSFVEFVQPYSEEFVNVFVRIGFGSTIKLGSFDKSQVVTFSGKFVCGFKNSDCGTGSRSDNMIAAHIDKSGGLRWVVSLIVRNSSVSSTKYLIQSTFSDENDVDLMRRAQSIYRDEHKGVLFSQEDGWAILKFHPKWDAPEQVDLTGGVPGATQEDLFGHDARPRPADKPRPAKKTKSDATTSTGESSASTQFEELMEQELRLKREAAERAFEAQARKDHTLMRLEELRFLATSTKDLDDDDAY
nr:hypothetical protein [Tanacetum cinerariifolium]